MTKEAIAKIMEGIEKDEMHTLYQGVIDLIYFTPATNEKAKWAAHYFACVIKECMTHKDSSFIGTGYIMEKTEAALKQLGLQEVLA